MAPALTKLCDAEKFQADHFETIVGCTFHGYNVKFKDLCAPPAVANFMNTYSTVLRFFRNRFRASDVLTDGQKQHKDKDEDEDD